MTELSMGGMLVYFDGSLKMDADGRKEQSGRGEKGKGTGEMVARDRI